MSDCESKMERLSRLIRKRGALNRRIAKLDSPRLRLVLRQKMLDSFDTRLTSLRAFKEALLAKPVD